MRRAEMTPKDSTPKDSTTRSNILGKKSGSQSGNSREDIGRFVWIKFLLFHNLQFSQKFILWFGVCTWNVERSEETYVGTQCTNPGANIVRGGLADTDGKDNFRSLGLPACQRYSGPSGGQLNWSRACTGSSLESNASSARCWVMLSRSMLASSKYKWVTLTRTLPTNPTH